MDGKLVSNIIKDKIYNSIKASRIKPKLVVILVGDDQASQIYVRNKERDCAECGIVSDTMRLPYTISEDELIKIIKSFSKCESVHGILVQMPLPAHINKDNVIAAISPKKDVDCFTPYNTGLLMQGNPHFLPCTPGGIIKLLEYYDITLSGKNCVIIGRSNIVGKPMALMAIKSNATVTVCNSHTKTLQDICKTADVLISAVGKSNFINHEYVKEGAIIIDVGINRNQNGTLCGDCTQDAYDMSLAYTPVPGGVGPMTRAMLMLNTTLAAGLEA